MHQIETTRPSPGQLDILISGCIPGAGGLFVLDTSGVSMIDPLSTHGLAVRNDRLYRVMGCQDRGAPSSDLLVYDEGGVRRFDRLDGIEDPHDVLPRDGKVMITSPLENAVYAIAENGTHSIVWKAAAPTDAWHLNCLIDIDGQLYASAFGRFEQHRAWSQTLQAPTGVVVRLPVEQVVLEGLTQPHSPRRLDDAWIICNSALNELAAYDDCGILIKSRRLTGYTRGLAFDERYLYVGESSSRRMSRTGTRESRLTILDRSDWSTVDSYEIEVAEIYDVLLVSKALTQGARIGFRTNVTRVEQQDQFAMFTSAGVQPRRLWAIGEPLPAASLRARLDCGLPLTVAVGQIFLLACKVSNLGDAIFVSAPPNPVQFCYRWFDAADTPIGAGQWIHTNLPHALPPGETAEAAVRIAAPHVPGTYTLAVTLLQEGVAWFDDISPTSGIRGRVVVT
jgi:acetolactate synthase-1/2/3 large subunit